MFDPIPPYSERDTQSLKNFHARVVDVSKRYGINYINRFVMMLDCCNFLDNLLKNQKENVWKRPSKEPLAEFQDVFQLFIYAVGDQGLLFDTFGNYNKCPCEVHWQVSEGAYKSLAFAMRDRNLAYLQLQASRQLLEAHSKQRYNYDNNKHAAYNPDPILVANLNMLLSKAGIDVNTTRISKQIRQAMNDSVLKMFAPLYLFFALQSNSSNYNSDAFKVDLKANLSRFPTPKQPKQIIQYQNDCKLFQVLLSAFNHRESPLPTSHLLQFNPFFILDQLCKRFSIEVSNHELAQLANCCLTCFEKPSNKQALSQFDYKIHDRSLGEIMQAFFVVFQAQSHHAAESTGVKPRSFNQSLKTLYEARVIDPIAGINYLKNKPSPSQLDQIKQRILDEYSNDSYSINQEAFWLITGYVPSCGYLQKAHITDLYSLCHAFLQGAWNSYIQEYRSASYNTLGRYFSGTSSLRVDVLKTRSFFTKFCTPETIHRFLIEAIKYSILLRGQRTEALRKYCLSEYRKVRNQKTSFKSFDYASDILGEELMDELFIQTGTYLYQQIFSTLASLNRYIWPM